METIYRNASSDIDHRDDARREARNWTGDRAATPSRTAATAHTACGTAWYHEAAIEAERLASIEARCNPYHS